MAAHHEGNNIWSLGFGTVDTNAVLDISPNLLPMVLLANTPQLLLTFLYFLYNSMYTCMLAASEWSQFAVHRKGLRVSSPDKDQRSTYWLQLPWLYSLPLGISAAILH